MNLTLGTVSFTVCFAVWGLISAFASSFRAEFHLTAKSTALLVAVPVLLGSVARIPMGMLTDRLGGRRVFTVLFVLSAIAAALVPQAHSFPILVTFAFFVGLAGSSFAVDVGYVSRWFAAEQQGTALGVYGLGNMGQSFVVFLGPVLAVRIGRANVFYGVAGIAVAWALIFGLMARDAPAKKAPTSLTAMFKVLTGERLAWVLSAFYFLTFGGFVAFSICLPSLLRDEFRLTAADAGFRTAGFVVLATLLRPAGGILADRIGGARVLFGVFLGVIPFALLLSWRSPVPFTVGALGCAALLGLGNGAVFKLVPQFFPGNTATVTGLVGAMGGLGGFFPPLLLGLFGDAFGVIWPGWVLLAATAALMWILNQMLFIPRQRAMESEATPQFSRAAEQIRAGALATMLTALLIASIVIGSRNLQNFDAALVIYTFAVIFATWGIVYHYAVWLNKPPTRRFFERSWSLLWSQGLIHSLTVIARAALTHIFAQSFIRRRSRVRWWMHQCLFWGCLLAVAITFPLVFGWIYFRSAPDNQMIYVSYLFGFPTGSFAIRTLTSWLLSTVSISLPFWFSWESAWRSGAG